jgi:hypothetical protein
MDLNLRIFFLLRLEGAIIVLFHYKVSNYLNLPQYLITKSNLADIFSHIYIDLFHFLK